MYHATFSKEQLNLQQVQENNKKNIPVKSASKKLAPSNFALGTTQFAIFLTFYI